MFHTCTQNECSFDNFLINIKKGKTCKFGSLEDSLICDRIVFGIDSKEIRERLLRDSKLTLNKAQNMVRAFKILRIQVFDLDGKTVADSIQKSKVWSNSDQRQHSSKNIQKCYYCLTTHRKQACPAYGKKKMSNMSKA